MKQFQAQAHTGTPDSRTDVFTLIQVVRDPRAVVQSMFNAGYSALGQPAQTVAQKVCWSLQRRVTAVPALRKQGVTVVQVKFEDILKDPEGAVQQTYARLGERAGLEGGLELPSRVLGVVRDAGDNMAVDGAADGAPVASSVTEPHLACARGDATACFQSARRSRSSRLGWQTALSQREMDLIWDWCKTVASPLGYSHFSKASLLKALRAGARDPAARL